MASDTDPLVVSSLAKDFALRLGFPKLEGAQIALAAGELASNCVRHAGGGCVELRATATGLELRATDHGPGIDLLSHASEDGVSRGRRHSPYSPVRDSLGAGLGSVQRLMDDVQVTTWKRGTTVVAKKHLREASE